MLEINNQMLHFSIDENAGNATFSGPGFTQAEDANFWRILLDDGVFIEMLIESRFQTGTARMVGEELHIHYDRLVAPDRNREFDITFDITVRKDGQGLAFWPVITNRQKGVRVNECACPSIEVSALNGPSEEDILYMPECSTCTRLKDPWNNLRAWNSCYLDGDEFEIVRSGIYPHICMAWMGVESNGQFLYIGRHDPELRATVIQATCSPYCAPNRLGLRFVHTPWVSEGETVEAAPSVVALVEGGWLEGSRIYRKWAEEAFYKPVKPHDWVRKMNGWQRLIMRSQYGDDYFTPEQLPDVWEEGMRHGINTLFLFGWWDSGMDNGYPEYKISPERSKALKESIATIQKRGGHVILVCTTWFFDWSTEYAKKYGLEQCQMNRRGFPQTVKVCYAPHSATRSSKMLADSPLFLNPCSGSPGWRETLICHFDMLANYDPDCMFYDCYGAHPLPFCFNSKHEHGNRVDEEWKYRRIVLDALNKKCGDRYVIGIEHTLDYISAHTEFTHDGLGSCNPDDYQNFPDMFRQTFPEVILSNRNCRDSRPGFEKALRYAFVKGGRFDVETHRCRTSMETEMPYALEIERLNGLRQKYGDYLLEGTFDVSKLPPLPQTIVAAQYIHRDGTKRLTILWNNSQQEENVMGVTLAPDEMKFIEA